MFLTWDMFPSWDVSQPPQSCDQTLTAPLCLGSPRVCALSCSQAVVAAELQQGDAVMLHRQEGTKGARTQLHSLAQPGTGHLKSWAGPWVWGFAEIAVPQQSAGSAGHPFLLVYA